MNSPRLLTFVRKRLLFLTYASLAALILGELGRFYWLPELFSHFVPYYTVILLLATLFSPQTWQKCFFGLSAVLLAVWMFTPLTNPPTPAPAQQRFISYNLYISNPHVASNLN